MPTFLLRKEWILLMAAVALALAAALFFWLWQPTVLRVAAGPREGSDIRLLTAFAKALDEKRAAIRLRLVPVEDVRQAAEALGHGQADLAVVRPDVLLPQNGLTLAILREEAAILLAPEASRIDDIGGLAKRRLGVVARHEADLPLLAAVLGHYDLAPPAVTLVPLAAGEVEAALRDRRIDAVAMIAPPASAAALRFVKAASRAAGKLAVLGVDEAEPLAKASPALSDTTIAAGTWGGRPKQPEEEVKTVAVSYRLMARADLDRSTVAEATQNLFQLRSRLATATATANLMKAPESDTSTSAALPNHPGATDYFQREQHTFMDRWGDWIYMLMFLGSGVASAGAWLIQRVTRQRRERLDVVLDRLLAILTQARAADAAAVLDELAAELDKLVALAVRYARRRSTSTRAMGALMLAIDAARAAIADRRRDVVGASEPALDETMPRSHPAAGLRPVASVATEGRR